MVHSSNKAFLGYLFIFIDELFELKNKMRLSKLLNIGFDSKKRATHLSSFSKNKHLREYKGFKFLLS